jgi:hypothetical protein
VTVAPGPRISAIGWVVGILVIGIVVAGSIFAFSRFNREEQPELTVEERLALVEGRTLTVAEVTELLGVGKALCELHEQILDEVWRRLGDDQLEFQDFVFAHLCPERSVTYAAHTGRYVTEEAERSGVVPSTTRPPQAVPSTDRPTTTVTTSRVTPPPSTADGTTTTTAPGSPTTVAVTGSTAEPTTTTVAGDRTLTLDPGLGSD